MNGNIPIESRTLDTAGSKQGRAWLLKRFLLIFLPSTILAGLGLAAHEYGQHIVEIEALTTKETTHVDVAKKLLSKQLETVNADLLFLSKSEFLQQLLERNTPDTKKRLADEFANLADHRKAYDQIRFIDDTGMEVVRVNYNNGNVFSVPEQKLQDKSKRYYFADTFKLESGEVFVSPLDLNIEHGRIERPFKPMLRIGTPVFDRQGVKRGIILLNPFGKLLIDRVRDALLGSNGTAMFVNSEGYWLSAPDPALEWGFMFGNEHTLAKQKPELWRHISTRASGQIWTNQGLYSFQTIYPLRDGQVSSLGSRNAHAMHQSHVADKDYFWKLITHVSNETATRIFGKHTRHSALGFLIFLTILTPVSWLLAKVWSQNRLIETAIRASEKRYRALYHDNPSMYFTTDSDGIVMSVNRYGAQQLGYDVDNLIGKSWLQLVNERDRHQTQQLLQRCLSTLDQALTRELRVLSQNKGELWLRATARAVDSSNGLKTILIVGEDITEKRAAEEILRLTQFSVDHAADEVFWLSPQGQISYVNEAACATLGYTKDELLAMSVHDIDPQFPIEAWQKHWNDVTTLGSMSVESQHRAKDGRVFPVEVIANYVRFNDNEYNCAFARDISERKRVEAEHEALHRQLVKASREAGMAEVASGVLHNVGNVLNSLNVSTNIAADKLHHMRLRGLEHSVRLLKEHAHDLSTFLSKDSKGKRLPDYLEKLLKHLITEHSVIDAEFQTIKTNLQHIKQVIAAQQSYTSVPHVSEPVVIPDLIEDALMMTIAAHDRVAIARDFETMPEVMLDRHKVLQILVNLLRNAKQSLDQHAGPKVLRIRACSTPNNTLRIEIEDSGVGIPPETQGRIFEYGFSTKKDGHGIGLHISALVAKSLGGSINFNSPGAGNGACFVLTLPMFQVERAA